MSKPHSWSDPAKLDDLFLYHLARLLAAAGSMVVRLCEGSYGITRREWRMVGLLAEHGTLPPSQLADLAQLDRTRTSRTITTLIGKGLVQRETLPGDARRALLQLTTAGKALYAELFPRVQAINMELLGDVPEQELQDMASAFARIREKAQQMQTDTDLPKAQRNRGAKKIRPQA